MKQKQIYIALKTAVIHVVLCGLVVETGITKQKDVGSNPGHGGGENIFFPIFLKDRKKQKSIILLLSVQICDAICFGSNSKWL
jgi:hypothetical protein